MTTEKPSRGESPGSLTMKALAAPDFSIDGARRAKDALSSSDKEMLAPMLRPTPLSDQQKTAFLEECGKRAYLVKEWRQKTNPADSRLELEQVALKARALLQAIGALSPDTRRTLRGHTSSWCHHSAPAVRLTDGTVRLMARKELQHELLAASWDVVSDLEQACRYASARISPSKQSKPSQSVGRGLVFHVAIAYQGQTGKLPPKSAESWFVIFMSALGEATGISVGAKLIAGVLSEMKT